MNGLGASLLRLCCALVAAAALWCWAPRAGDGAESPLPPPFDASLVDRSKNACSDFFAYATSRYLTAHPIPPAYEEYGYIEALVDRTREIVRSILEDARAERTAGGDGRQIGAFYGACMDSAAIERAGLRPIAAELARIDAIADRPALVAELARLRASGTDVAFDVGATQDFRDASRTIAELDQAGIGLPERDYYVRSDAASATVRARYRHYVATLLALSGDRAASANADAVLAFETTLARASLPAAQLRVPERLYHPMTLAALSAAAPHLAFRTYFARGGVPAGGTINVAEPAFVTVVDAAVATGPLAVWKTYLRWRLLDGLAPALPAAYVAASYEFHGRTLNGVKAQLPRWKRCVTATNEALGEAIGKLYVARVFVPPAKQDALAMTEGIRAAFRARLAAVPWMSAPTKQIALDKLDATRLKVGYPDRWRSYEGLALEAAPYAAAVVRTRAFERHYELGKIGRPVDRNDWFISPQTVNAYYDGQRNEIVVPAAQLQAPFYAPGSDIAANLGATGGGTIGHEFTHGFDDEGRKFDRSGNLRDWWSAEDAKRFDARAGCIVRQFDRTVAIGKTHYQGSLVSGEAIADLGGVTIGYTALGKAATEPASPGSDGFTPAQRYFLAFAQSWTEALRPEFALRAALTDPHPLPRDRVNQTVANIPAWYDAFNCPKPPQSRCEVW